MADVAEGEAPTTSATLSYRRRSRQNLKRLSPPTPAMPSPKQPSRPPSNMMRRSHKKSRNGCLECKKRRVKCDETHPICVSCKTAERPWACVYIYRGTDAAGAGKNVEASSTSATAGSPDALMTPSPSNYASVSPAAAVERGLQHMFPPQGPEEEPPVNLGHMELFNQFVTETYKLYLIKADVLWSSKLAAVENALVTPFLMHQLLALAARHLSIVRPEKADFYHRQAMQLQTCALTLFNSVDLSQISLIPVFLFACFLGHHALCDTLSYRDADFGTFHERFANYLALHRGVQKVVRDHIPVLLNSELRPFMEPAFAMSMPTGTGHDCDLLRARVAASALETQELHACGRAIDHLQWVIEARANRTEGGSYVILSWTLFVTNEYVGLIERANPESLAILAYYAALLHFCHEPWFVQDAGIYLVRMLTAHLGPAWAEVMWLPNHLIDTQGERLR